MTAYCTECGTPLDQGCDCSLDAAPLPLSPVPVANDVGPLPKASTARRLLGSGIEFLAYALAILVLNVLSPMTAGALGFLGVPLLLAMVGLRDLNAGGLSLSKRVGRMRVVSFHNGQPASEAQALVRNSYYLVLIFLMIIPFTKTAPSTFFLLLVLVDFLMIVASPEGRRIGDLLAGTQVVQEARRPVA